MPDCLLGSAAPNSLDFSSLYMAQTAPAARVRGGSLPRHDRAVRDPRERFGALDFQPLSYLGLPRVARMSSMTISGKAGCFNCFLHFHTEHGYV